MNPNPFHRACGHGHDPADACPPTTRHRIQWGVRLSDGEVTTAADHPAAARAAEWLRERDPNAILVHRYISTTDWLPTGHDHEEPS